MRHTWLFNMQLPISQSNKSRKWCWWIYGNRKEKKRMITHWRFRRSLEITFELCFSSFTGIFSSLLFLSSFYCATHISTATMIFLFSSENFITRKSESESDKVMPCRTWTFLYIILCISISRTRFSLWAPRMENFGERFSMCEWIFDEILCYQATLSN